MAKYQGRTKSTYPRIGRKIVKTYVLRALKELNDNEKRGKFVLAKKVSGKAEELLQEDTGLKEQIHPISTGFFLKRFGCVKTKNKRRIRKYKIDREKDLDLDLIK